MPTDSTFVFVSLFSVSIYRNRMLVDRNHREQYAVDWCEEQSVCIVGIVGIVLLVMVMYNVLVQMR